jgi:glycerol-3-phosphate dehydrogenase
VIQPTLWGNLLLGPTARDMHNSEHMARTNEGIMSELITKCKLLVNGFDVNKVIHSFAGKRAKSTVGDWVIEENDDVPGMILSCGIDSPGLAASPAIAKHVVEVLLHKSGLELPKNKCFNPFRLPIIRPKRGWKDIKIDHKDPEKNVICKCEKVTEAEIVDAIGRSLECSSTQAIRKRTRAGMGHCQGQFCESRVTKLIAKTLNVSEKTVPGRPWPASSILPQRWPTDEEKQVISKLA